MKGEFLSLNTTYIVSKELEEDLRATLAYSVSQTIININASSLIASHVIENIAFFANKTGDVSFSLFRLNMSCHM